MATTEVLRPSAGRQDGPVLRPGVVARDAVLAALRRSGPSDLVVVAAPAGYGKTTAVALWDHADERPFAWVALDRLDDDPVHLLQHVAAAVGRLVDLRPEVAHLLGSPGRSARDDLIPALVAGLADAEPLVLVLDDVHSLGSDAARSCLAALVDALGTAVQPVLIGRSATTVPLARRRLEGTVVEIGPEELALSVDEAGEAFARLGLTLDHAATEDLVTRAEGWAAGLHLAALAARAEGIGATVLSGRHRLVADYLVEEVLHGVDPAVTRFLEDSAVLDRMDADTLDELLDRHDSQARLRQLEDSGNLFLIPLDDERRSYRYHHLFADLLHERLRARDPERLRLLHRRAADRFEAIGDVDAAIGHAVAAADEKRAAALVMGDAVRLAFDGRSGVLARRLAQLGDRAAERHADAAVATAWYGLSLADPVLILQSLQQAAAVDDGHPLGDGTPSVAVAAALLRSMLAVEGIDGILRDTTAVVDGGDWTTNPWWGLATGLRATALAAVGELREARRLLAAALPALGALPGTESACHAWLALVDLDAGDTGSARLHAELGRRIADRHGLDGLVFTTITYSVDALVAARSGHHRRASQALDLTERLLDRLGETAPRTALVNHVVAARACLHCGEGTRARHHLRGARRAAGREPAATWLHAQLTELEGQVDAATASSALVTPLTDAERRVLPHLASHQSLKEIARELHVSRNTVKSHTVAIYRKLAVSSRSDAVAEARRLGLLTD